MNDLFSASSHGRYFYFYGVNLRAFAAFIIGFILPLPGFVASFGYTIAPAASHMYSLGWVLSWIMGSLSYYIICLIFPVPGDDGSYPFESKVAESQSVLIDGIDLSHGIEARTLEAVGAHQEKTFDPVMENV